MSNGTVPTPITDKNGKNTTVHKRVDGAVASKRVTDLAAFDASEKAAQGTFFQRIEDVTKLLVEEFGTTVVQRSLKINGLSALIEDATKRFNTVRRAEFVARAQEENPGLEAVDYRIEQDYENGGYIIDVTSFTIDGKAVSADSSTDKLSTLFKDNAYAFLGDAPDEGDNSFVLDEQPDLYKGENEFLTTNFPDPIMDNESVSVLLTQAEHMKEAANYKNMGDKMKGIDPAIEGVQFNINSLEENIGYSADISEVIINGSSVAVDDLEDAEDIRDIFNAYIYDTLAPSSTRVGWTSRRFLD